MRAAITATTICWSVNGHSQVDSGTPLRRETHIATEDLESALRTLEQQRNLELIFLSEDMRGVRTRGAQGNLTVEEALQALLQGTGLTYRHASPNTVTIVPSHDKHPVDPPQTRDHPKPPAALEEVIVTAQKRTEFAQDIPGAVSAIGAAQLEALGATQLSDYAAYLPGLSVVQGSAPGEDMLILRGLSMTSESALVGTYIDDTPVSSSSDQQPTMRRALDLLPYDFERVEVLEGPQGTLYGANAMGGLVKYITRKPDLESLSALIGADWKENEVGSEAGWSARGNLNAPIVPGKVAVRVSLSQDFTPGFIAEPNQGRADGNQSREQAAHLALLIAPSAAWSGEFSALLQDLHSPDPTSITLTNHLTPDSGRWSDSRPVPQTFASRLQYYSASVNGDLHWASFTAATSYSAMQSSEWAQIYYPMDQFTGRASEGLQLSANKLTQELRLASPGGGRLTWLLGAFYTHEQADQLQSVYALNDANVAVQNSQLNPELHLFAPSSYREYAVFGNTTWKLTQKLDLTLGLRESRNEQTFSGIPTCSSEYVGAIGPCPSQGNGAAHQNVFNFSAGPAWHVTPGVMAYLRVASGYRPGGPNVPAPGIPTSVAADTLLSSELGVKTTWLDHKLRVDAAAYQIDWNHIQVITTAPAPVSIQYAANGNSATVRGFETATVLAPVAGLRFGLSFTYTHAILTEPMPTGSTVVGNSGDRLPYIPLWSGALTADYTQALQRGWLGSLGAGWHYTGQRYTTIDNPNNCPLNCAGAQRVPSLSPYGALDLHAGLANPGWDVRLAVRNLTNKYALVDIYGGGGRSFDPTPVAATVLSGRLFTFGIDRRF